MVTAGRFVPYAYSTKTIFRENLNDIHFMAKIENVLSNEDLMKHYQQIDLNKLTLKGKLPHKGDMLDRTISVEDPMNQRYWNMADNNTLKRPMVEDIKSWIGADDYTKPAKRFLIHGTRYRNSLLQSPLILVDRGGSCRTRIISG